MVKRILALSLLTVLLSALLQSCAVTKKSEGYIATTDDTKANFAWQCCTAPVGARTGNCIHAIWGEYTTCNEHNPDWSEGDGCKYSTDPHNTDASVFCAEKTDATPVKVDCPAWAKCESSCWGVMNVCLSYHPAADSDGCNNDMIACTAVCDNKLPRPGYALCMSENPPPPL